MADPVSLALGIAPIFLTCVQGFSVLKQTIHSLRHHRREISWLRTKVEIQARCFRGQIHHLVIDTFDDRTAQSLISDDNHTHWKSKNLEDTLAKYMGELYTEFIKAIQGVKAASVQIETKLSIFAPPDVTSPLFQATRDKFRLTFRKQEYYEDIRTLKEWIAELKRIRKLASAVKKQSKAKTKQPHKEYNEPTAGLFAGSDVTTVQQYNAIWRLSSDFQALLQRQWRCCDRSHSSHSGGLFLCCISPQNRIAWFLEHTGRRGCTSLSDRLLFHVSSRQLGPMTHRESPDQKPIGYFDGPIPKRQRISPQGHVSCIAKKSDASDIGNEFARSDASSPGDIESLCRQLNACSVTSAPGTHSRHLSYVDVHRQQFMFEPRPTDTQNLGGWDTHRITPLTELLNYRVRDVMLDHERILLALALVRGTLMNHSTLGWSQGCVMEGISFFSKIHADLNMATLLNTLHITVQVGNSIVSDTDMEGGSVTAAVSKDEFQYTFGIRNLVLYRLGVALLSIGLWTKINWEDVSAVRRKAAALDSFGKRFSYAVERLIYGDFGVDTADLSNERLQVEILRTVIAPLEKLAELHRLVEPDRWPRQAAPNW